MLSEKNKINIVCSYTHLPEWRRSEMGAAPSPWQPPPNSDANIAATQFVAIATKDKIQPINFTPRVLSKNTKEAPQIHGRDTRYKTNVFVYVGLTSSSRVSSSSSSSWLWFNRNWMRFRTSLSSNTKASLYLQTTNININIPADLNTQNHWTILH